LPLPAKTRGRRAIISKPAAEYNGRAARNAPTNLEQAHDDNAPEVQVVA
jgi:hypothetical protein